MPARSAPVSPEDQRPEPGPGAGLAAALAAIVGPTNVLVDPELRAPFETDWTRRFGGPSLPGGPARIDRRGGGDRPGLRRPRVSVVVQGGNTGLVGGGVPPAHRPATTGTGPPVVAEHRPPGRASDPVDRWPPR